MADAHESTGPRSLERAGELLADAARICVLTGAGISTDSGIPDFRGPNGLWTRDPDAEKTSDISYYVSDPAIRRKAWQGRIAWFESEPEPNDGHRALVELERTGRLHTIITQNIDGLHQAAGSSPERVVEVHGTIREYSCLRCRDRGPIERVLARVHDGEEDPACGRCGGILKSATVSFGQSLDPVDLERAFAAAESCDVFLAVGSTLSVYPVAQTLPVARRAGAAAVIVNGGPTDLDDLADAVVRGSISALLPRLCAAALGNS